VAVIESIKPAGSRSGGKNTKHDAFIRRVHEIHAHGYENPPGTKVLRTVWSSRTEPPALSKVSSVNLDGAVLTLCRFGRDTCDNCFSTQHRTSGCARATARATAAAEERDLKRQQRAVVVAEAAERRKEARREAREALRHGGGDSINGSRNNNDDPDADDYTLGSGAGERSAGGASVGAVSTSASSLGRLDPAGGRVPITMRSNLAPVLLGAYGHVAGHVMRETLNGRANTNSVVDTLGSAVDPRHRGKMASRGIHELAPLTALELSNGMPDTRLGSERFRDLSHDSALASTLVQRRWLHNRSTHLLPTHGPKYVVAAARLHEQHGDFLDDDHDDHDGSSAGGRKKLGWARVNRMAGLAHVKE